MPTAVGTPSGSTELHGFKRLWRAVKQLFYEAAGAMFAILALGWLNSAFRAWTRDVAHWLIAVTVAVALLFVFFAVSSFRRARSL
jgi:NhaP-type Na+/H+ or K+/H+ antiporter